LAIDDFGTGYSSLACLKRYPIDKLKIDRSFVRDIPGDGDDVAITTAIVQMAHSLKLLTVAEGVETPAQAALLHSLGCDQYQGYLVSRPVDAAGLQAWMSARGDNGAQLRLPSPRPCPSPSPANSIQAPSRSPASPIRATS